MFKEKPEPIIITFDAGDSDRVTDIDDMNYVVTGKVQSEAEIESVTVNGREISIESDGSFSTVVALNRGANRINVVAKNVDSEEVSAELPVFVDLPKKVTSDDVIAEYRENMIVYPHFGTPAFIEPGQTFIAQVAATDVTTSGWTAYIENDLRRWDCTVGEVVYGEGNIYLGMRSGYTIEIQVPEDVSPELFDLVLTHTESGKTFKSPHALSIVPELDTNFYMLGVSDTHMYWFEHASNTIEGGNDGKSYGLMAKVATLGGARYFSHTGDISLSGAVSRAVGIKDYLVEPAVTMGRVPIVIAPGNHEYDPYVSPIPSTTEGDRTGDFAFEDADRYFGMRSQIIDMGTFALVKSDYGCYWGDFPLRQAMTDVWNAVFGDPECKYTYRLLLQHTHNASSALFYNAYGAPPIAPYPSLEIKGHNHRYSVDQVNPFLIISQGGGEDWKQGTGLFFNFNVDENYNWTCPEATPSYNGSNRVALVKDARNGYDITVLRDSYLYANNGTATSNVCTIINEINFNFYDGRVRFEMAQGRYKVTGGTILSQYDYEDERGWHTAVLVDVDIAPNAVTTVTSETTYNITVTRGQALKVTAAAGEEVTIVADEASAGQVFKGWQFSVPVEFLGGTDAYSATVKISMPASDLHAEATYEDLPEGSPPTPGPIIIDDGTDDETEDEQVDVVVDEAGNAKATLSENWMQSAVDKALEEAGETGGKAKVVVEVQVEEDDVNSVEINIPKAAIDILAEGNVKTVEITSPVATIVFDEEAISAICSQATEDVEIISVKVDPSDLSDDIRAKVGDRPVYDFSVKSGDKTISEFGGNVTVTVPYTLKAGEDPNAVVIYFINDQGDLEIVRNCVYDPSTGTISFRTDHFSKYMVGYNKVAFNDVAANSWYYDAVTFIAARRITEGTGNGNYSPAEDLTRGQFIVMLMRAYGLEPDADPTDNFADAGNTYYTGYLAAAKRLGISAGIGNNLFGPELKITRQEMFTLLYNILKHLDEFPEGTSGKTVSEFSDAGSIASWAKEAMSLFVKTGVIKGDGNKLKPVDNANRAEIAQILYSLLTR